MGLGNIISPHRRILLAFGLIAIFLFQSPPVRGKTEEDPQKIKVAIEVFHRIPPLSKSGSQLEARKLGNDEKSKKDLATTCAILNGDDPHVTREEALDHLRRTEVNWREKLAVIDKCCKLGSGCTPDKANEIAGVSKVSVGLGFLFMVWIPCLLF